MNGNYESALSEHVSSYLPDYVADRLPPVRRLAIEAHLRGCLACQREYDEWQMLASAVRSADSEAMSPIPFARAWSDLRARLPAGSFASLSSSEKALSDQTRHNRSVQVTVDSKAVPASDAPIAMRVRRTAIQRTLVVAALIALVISGFAVVFSRLGDARRPAGTPTSTLAPAPVFTWVDATIPPIPASYASVLPDIGGDVAYVCSFPQGAPNARPAVWRSGDRAKTWTRIADIPFTHGDIKNCFVMSDQIDTRIAVAGIGWGEIDATTHKLAHESHFVTFDAGASWRELPIGQDQSWLTLATFGGRTMFVLRDPTPDSLSFILMVSDDQLKTATAARRAGTPPMASGDFIRNIWMEPTHGQILLEMRSQADISDGALWMSNDWGQSWRAMPMDAPLLGQITVRAPRAGGAWSVCGVPSNGNSTEAARAVGRLEIVCSFDGGASWRKINGVTNSGSGNIIGIAHDGAVLGFIQDLQNKSTTFYWLTPGATEWQVLESEPRLGVVIFLVSAGAHDVLWRQTFDQTDSGGVDRFSTAVY